GRMDTARLPVELLLCNEMPKAIQMANRIDILNKERKKIQGEMVEQAKAQVEAGKKGRTILVLYSEFWHHGIVGIAAGKICETYRKPVIMLSMKEDGKTVVGSARSIPDINIYELIKECSGKLVKFGGHAMAAGLSLEKEQLESFTAEIEALAQKKYFIKDVQTIEVDMELSISQITEEMNNALNEAGPYGEGFQRPVFFSRSVEVVCDRKTEANHHIMLVSGSDAVIHAVKWFGDAQSYEDRKFDIVYTINKNRRGENNILQLNILNMGEATGKASKNFNGEIYDVRGLSPYEVCKEYSDAVFFHEGFKINFDKGSLLNRYGIRKTETLVFLSTPVNSKVFKEVILYSNPSKIVLNFSYLPDYSFKGFVMNLLGIVKHFIEKDGGYGYLEDMAIKLSIEESVVIAGLKYLKAMGKIDFILDIDYGRLLVLKGKGDNKEAALKCERNLINALEEKKAFRDFIFKLDVKKFREYLI
ncbi:MAG TPA: DHHA1 domain-containing protein, partial [Clostridia bacterium]